MLDQCPVQPLKKTFLTHWFWDNIYLQPCKYKMFNEMFQYILKSLRNFFDLKVFLMVMPKNTNKTTETNFDLATNSSNQKY